ncbi:MAG TPA: hypothetical protein VF316_11305 [Polyangiaceae bacterium]
MGPSIRLRAFVLLLAVTSYGGHALAQSEDDKRAGARATATEGARAMDEGRWADAASLFARAESLVHAPPHLLYYARASVKLGKLVQANEAYLKILRETLPPKAPKAFVDAQAAAEAEQPSVEQRVPHLTIVVEGNAAKDAHVTLNGTEVAQPLLGIPAPFDPGDLVFEAVAPGWRSEQVKISLKEGARETVKLTLSIADAAAAPPPVLDTTPKVVATAPKTGLRAAGWISVGIGVVAMAAGTYFVIDNHNKRGDADALCTGPGGVCPAAQRSTIQSLDSDANTSAILSWIGYGVGGVGVGMGVVMLLLSRGGHTEPETPPPTATIRPWFGLGSAGLSGTF